MPCKLILPMELWIPAIVTKSMYMLAKLKLAQSCPGNRIECPSFLSISTENVLI